MKLSNALYSINLPHLTLSSYTNFIFLSVHSKSSNIGRNISEDDFDLPKLIPIRAQTAPPRPLTEIEEFRRSPDFLLLENTVMMSDHLKQRADEKYDLDSEDGQRACKRFLNQIERLCEVFKADCAARTYREQFSKAYKVLYKEGSLCYLTEILDSAQEGFPYLWVNGEKYVFSHEVLDAGRKLFHQFRIIQNVIRNLYERIIEDTVNITVQSIIEDMAKHLDDFDQTWVNYEQIYVLELMLIEADARRYITEAIETDKELAQIEQKEKARGRIVVDTAEYTEKRSKLITILGKINSVANPEGMGRDDLGSDILLAAEGIFRRISPTQSKAVRNLAERIKKAFNDFKTLLRKYDQNIEVVDPQLKNNAELVEILVEFENSWSQGLTYFLDSKTFNQLLHFSQVIEATAEKHKQFFEQLEQRDTEIFFIIPQLLILKSLENDDKQICSFFYPDMYNPSTEKGKIVVEMKKIYEQCQKKLGSYEFYNLLEKCLIEVELTAEDKARISEMRLETTLLKEIKGLAMCLSRFKPADWNKFLDVVIK